MTPVTKLYHGTSKKDAANIIVHGVLLSKCEKGYFGKGFYTTPDINVAKDNYADFSDEGAILVIELMPNTKIMDLQDEKDWLIWRDNYSHLVSEDNFPAIMKAAKIDALKDNSFEGVVIYNPKRIERMYVHC